ncbi:MAG: L-threonine 3-dehydrogenase [Bacillota bacterium]|nr:L-threonine 3-dehydrogenase [Bacillota bacterium]
MKGIVKESFARGAALRRDLPDPRPGEGEVVVKVEAAAICGTDLHIYNWSPWAQARVKPPMVFGHEFAGKVVETGPYVRRFKTGDRVAGETHIACGECRQCLTGNAHNCENMKIIGVHTPGAFADYICIPETCGWHLDEALSYEEGACLEPMGVAMHGLEAARVGGKDIVILGAGPIGLMAVGIARAHGARRVIVSEPVQARLDAAGRWGATHTVRPDREDLKAVVMDVTSGAGADAVIDYSGSPRAIQAGFSLIRKGGTVVLVGLPSEPIVIDVSDSVIYKEAWITGVTGRTMYGTWLECQKVLDSGHFNIGQIIAARYPFNEFESAFEDAINGIPGKVILVP